MITLPNVLLTTLASELDKHGVAAELRGDDLPVSGVSIDSRNVQPGMLFICKGAGFRPEFLVKAQAAGAAAYLCASEAAPALEAAAPGMPHLVVGDVRKAMAYVSPIAFGNPDQHFQVVGITGTKGKSTVSYMMRSILIAAGQEPSILGSIDTDDGVEHFESHNTTPEAPDLWRHLFHTAQANRRSMVMEVSSQGLKYDRTLGLSFDIACFLNIGRDHISPAEHPSFEDYFESKLRIFDQCKTAVVNVNSDDADAVLERAKRAPKLITFGVERDDADYTARDIQPNDAGIAFTAVRPNGDLQVQLGITGLFNVDNALAAIVMAQLLGVDDEAILKGLAHFRVPGRMELVRSAYGSTIAVVDYAHNELSFDIFFKSMKSEYPGRKIVAVFGAPGCKAYERREVLPRTAAKYADYLIYTEEDPAHDDPLDICNEMAANTPAGVPHEVIVDREAAIARAFEVGGKDNAVVCLLAKGDETRQHRGDEYPEVKSDLQIAREILGQIPVADAAEPAATEAE